MARIKYSFLFFCIAFFCFSIASVVCSTENPSILFIHHSVGHSLIRDGCVREILAEEGFDFWDHGYNDPEYGLRGPDGTPAGCYWIPDNNTYPVGLAKLFRQDTNEVTVFNKIINNHDVIVFKSCFPACRIKNDDIKKDLPDPGRKSLYNYKRHYTSIKNTIEKYPEKRFIFFTPPPLHPDATDMLEARRARLFSKWLKSSDYIGEIKNIFVFDYFDFLADPETNTLKTEYIISPKEANSHPNGIAQMKAGVKLADFIVNIIKKGANNRLPEVEFDNPAWPDLLIRVPIPSVSLNGKVVSKEGIRKLFWYDMRGNKGDLIPDKSWSIKNIPLNQGVTRIIVTAVNNHGLRSSSLIGVQYYTEEEKSIDIFNKSLQEGTLQGISYSNKSPFNGKQHLIINGDGEYKRVVINNIDLNISKFDPLKTYLELYMDKVGDTNPIKFIIPGFLLSYLNVDNNIGYERVIIPFKEYTYVNNLIERIIIKGKWSTGSKIYIGSIKLKCPGHKTNKP